MIERQLVIETQEIIEREKRRDNGERFKIIERDTASKRKRREAVERGGRY